MEKLIKLLESMVDILEEEKKYLINNEANKIKEIVEKKNAFVKELEEFKGQDFSKDKEVLKLIEKIDGMQETNLLLTNQALNYNNLFLDALKEMTDDKTSGYSKDGKISKTKVKNIIDQTV